MDSPVRCRANENHDCEPNQIEDLRQDLLRVLPGNALGGHAVGANEVDDLAGERMVSEDFSWEHLKSQRRVTSEKTHLLVQELLV